MGEPLSRLPRRLLRVVRDLRLLQNFRTHNNGVRGIFSTFSDAALSAPKNGVVGYESDQHAVMYDDRIGKLLFNDYPVIFWFSRLLPEIRSVFDLGGHKGELYWGFRERLELSAVKWLVCDVPATAQEGERFAAERGIQSLTFTSDSRLGDGADLVIASGVLQYIEDDLDAILGRWKVRPKFLIVNNTPLYEGEDYVTLQNIALSYNPYRVFNRSKLISKLGALGYEMKDHWHTGRTLHIPLHPDRFVDSYQGFVMVRA